MAGSRNTMRKCEIGGQSCAATALRSTLTSISFAPVASAVPGAAWIFSTTAEVIRSFKRGRASVNSMRSNSGTACARRRPARIRFCGQGYHARMPDMKPPPMGTDARTRTFAEARVVDYLLLCGWAHDAHRGDCGDGRRAVRAALDRSTALGLPFARAADGGRLYDPAEVVNFLKWAGVRHQDAFWRDHYVPQGRALVRAFHGARTATGVPPPPATLPPRRFDVELEREFALARMPSRTRTHAARPGADRGRACCATSPSNAAPRRASTSTSPSRRAAWTPASRRRSPPPFALTVRASFTALAGLPDPRAMPLSPADVDLYTRARRGPGPCLAARACAGGTARGRRSGTRGRWCAASGTSSATR